MIVSIIDSGFLLRLQCWKGLLDNKNLPNGQMAECRKGKFPYSVIVQKNEGGQGGINRRPSQSVTVYDLYIDIRFATTKSMLSFLWPSIAGSRADIASECFSQGQQFESKAKADRKRI